MSHVGWKSAEQLVGELQSVTSIVAWRTNIVDLFFKRGKSGWMIEVKPYSIFFKVYPDGPETIDYINSQNFQTRSQVQKVIETLFPIEIKGFERANASYYSIPGSLLLLEGWQGDWNLCPISPSNMPKNHFVHSLPEKEVDKWNHVVKINSFFSSTRKEVLQQFLTFAQSNTSLKHLSAFQSN